jgi:hypothetical protein
MAGQRMTRAAFEQHFADQPDVLRWADSVVFTDAGCWEFPAPETFRYAKRVIGGRYVFMHRLSLEVHRGEPLGDLVACHRCDNPPCVNPAHLFAGTRGDNQRDMAAKGRARNGVRLGLANNKATLTDEQIGDALRALDAGETRTSVAARLGVTRRAVQQWQLGIARREALRRYRLREGA